MKKHIHKLASTLLVGLILLSLFSGCGGGTSSQTAPAQDSASSARAVDTSKASEPSSEPITLSFIRAGTDERAQNAYNALIEAYGQEHPNVTIEYQQYNFGAELETKMNTLYASGSAPDVVRAPISTIALRASMGQYAPLDEYIDSWDEKDKVLQTAYDVASYKDHRYGVAINVEANFMFYRKDHFVEAGLDPQNPPKTWEQLYEYAEKLAVREGNSVVRSGISIPVGQGHIFVIPFSRMNGGKLVDIENNEPVFNEKQTVEALDYLASYNLNKLVIPFVNNQDQNPFELGKASMMIGTLPVYNTILASGVDWVDQLMFAPMVSRETKSGFGGCQIMFLSEEGKHKDQAWDFVKFLFSDDSVWKLVTDAGATPVKAGLSDKFMERYPEIGPTYLDALTYCEGMPKVEWAALFEKYINIAYEEAMYGQKDAQTALNDAIEQLKSEMAG